LTGLVEVDRAGWDGLLASLRRDDAYLLRAYVESASVLEPGDPSLLHLGADGGDVVLALLRREIPGGAGRDVTTPYGYGGPVAVGADPPVGDFWALYEKWCSSNGIVSTFIRFHPLFANQALVPESVRVEPIGSTVGWRLDRPDLFAGMHGSHRTACRKALKAGVSVEARERPADLTAFSELHDETMRRVGAGEFYFFGSEYYDALGGLGRRLVVFDAVVDGEVVASALCFATPPWIHYHLGATAGLGRELGASSLLLLEAAGWAKQRGFERFHLGGGAGGRMDSLLSFKRRFDPGGLLQFSVGKAVHDPEAYARLAGTDEVELEGFFPAYRAPASASRRPSTTPPARRPAGSG
jgi:serine/alanine adding enzyme